MRGGNGKRGMDRRKGERGIIFHLATKPGRTVLGRMSVISNASIPIHPSINTGYIRLFRCSKTKLKNQAINQSSTFLTSKVLYICIVVWYVDM